MLTSILESLESLEVYCCLFSAMLIGSLVALTSRAPVIAYFDSCGVNSCGVNSSTYCFTPIDCQIVIKDLNSYRFLRVFISLFLSFFFYSSILFLFFFLFLFLFLFLSSFLFPLLLLFLCSIKQIRIIIWQSIRVKQNITSQFVWQSIEIEEEDEKE